MRGIVQIPDRGGERVVSGVPALRVLVPEERRELDHPEDVVAARGDQVEAARDLHPQRAQRLADGRDLIGDDQQQIARLRLQALAHRRDLPFREELGDRRAPPLVLHERPHEALGAVLLGELGERVELRSGQLARRRR